MKVPQYYVYLSTYYEEWLKNVFDSNVNEKKNTLKTRGIAISYDVKKK